MAQINLAPDTQHLAVARRRRRNLFLLSISIAVITLIVWSVLFAIQQNYSKKLNKTETDLKSIKTEIARLNPEADRVKLFEERLQALDKLMNKRVNWLPVLQELEQVLPATTILNKLEISSANTFKVSGKTPNIDAVAQTIASLSSSPDRQTMFSNANIRNVAIETTKGEDDQVVSIVYKFEAEFTLSNKK